MIANVFLWSNGMVTACDQDGHQLPEYQGRLDHVLDKVLADAPPDTRFRIGAWGGGVLDTTGECFECWREVIRTPG